MKTSVLKKATLVNKGAWTTKITLAAILSESGEVAEVGKTCVIIEQNFYQNKHHSFKKIEIFEHHEFEKAYDRFHVLLKIWL